MIVRLYAAIYQHVDIHFHRRKEECIHRGLELVCAEPFDSDGKLTDIARAMLISEVRARVKETGFRMCIVLAPDRALYVEMDGSVEESNEPPHASLEGLDLEVYQGGDIPTRESLSAESEDREKSRFPGHPENEDV
jgi:hypothetical protein